MLFSLHTGQLSFLLQAASDTLPTVMNLQQWNIQCSVRCSAKCALGGSLHPTTAHVLSGCLVALSQDRLINITLCSSLWLIATFIKLYVNLTFIRIYADLPNL